MAQRVKNGVTFCWVTTIEHKTGKGQVEYLVPELTIEALSLLAKYSVPIRKELDEEIRQLASNRDFSYSTEHLLRLEKPEKTRINYFWDETHKEGKFRKAITLRLSAGKHPMLRLTV